MISLTVREFPSGQNLTGVVHLDVVTQPNPQKGVQFYVDNTPFGAVVASAPFTVALDTATLPTGSHTIKAEARYKTRVSTAQIAVTVGGVAPPPPPPPPPGRTWPASFFTGPLGTNNILPTSASGIFLAAMNGGYGYTWPEAQTAIQTRQQQMGRKYDVIQGHKGGDLAGGWPADQYGPLVYGAPPATYWQPYVEDWVRENGSEFFFAWTPSYTIAQMNQGAADPVWTKMATYLKSFAPQRIIIRAFHEFDGASNTYCIRTDWSQQPPYPVTPAQFASAWHRMVDVFHAQVGATNVGFMVCPMEGAIDRSVLATYINAIGPTWYDWIGTDWYNTVYAQSSPLHAGWASWEEIFHYDALGANGWSQYAIYGGGYAVSGQKGVTLPQGLPVQKPFMIGETGSLYDPAVPTRKGDWFRDIVAAAKKMPELIGISFYDQDVSGAKVGVQTGDYDWRVDRATTKTNVIGAFDQASLDGFVAMAKDPYFYGR